MIRNSYGRGTQTGVWQRSAEVPHEHATGVLGRKGNDLIHRSLCRKLAMTLGAFKVVFCVTVLNSHQRLAVERKVELQPQPPPPAS